MKVKVIESLWEIARKNTVVNVEGLSNIQADRPVLVLSSDNEKVLFIQNSARKPLPKEAGDESPLDFVNLKRYICNCGGLPR